MKRTLLKLAALTLLFPVMGMAQDLMNPLDAESDLATLEIAGGATIDTTQAYMGDGSLKVEPGASVKIPVQSGDDGGSVTFYIYDDLTVPADPTVRRTGPLFGLATSEGMKLAIGGMYAPYLSADGLNHVATLLDPGGQGNWFGSIQYLTGMPRLEGWSKWTFDMDPIAGLRIYRDDVQVNSFTWANSPLPGFNAIIIQGDAVDESSQTIWIDEVMVEKKGEMKINPDGTPKETGGTGDFLDLEFDSEADLAGSSVTGAAIDTEFKMDGDGSLQVPPGASVYIQISDIEQAATVTLYHYDDMTVPSDPLARRTGPRFGLRKPNGTTLAIGGMYAPYLNGQTYYSSSWYDTSGSANWYTVQYLKQARRSEGWHKWVFDLDPESGLKLYIDDIQIVAFEWADAPLTQFSQLAFLGDADDGEGQTFWIDNVSVEFKGPSEIDPGDVDPIAPPSDPEYTGPPIGLVGNLVQVHPRVILTEDQLPALREFFNADGSVHRGTLLSAANSADSWGINTNWVSNATEGQRVGLWYLPSLAYAYLMTGETRWLNGAIDIMTSVAQQPSWDSTAGEQDSGMSAGNVLGGMAIAYDWLHDDLPEGLRNAVRDKLWTHARRMYYGGHLGGNGGGSYWVGDPQTNHRYHRNYGFILATIAAYEGDPSQDWLLSKAMEEIAYIAEWLPEDGSNHESIGYHIFGLPHLYSAIKAADVAFGTNYRDQGYFENLGLFWAMSITPDRNDVLRYGDVSGGVGSYNYALYAAADYHGQNSLLTMIDFVREKRSDAFPYAWMGLIEYDGHPRSSITPLPKAMYFPDMEIALMRDKIATAGVAAMFKCGPMGGHTLNAFRDANNFKYINVAHDDPDANSFQIWSGGGFIAPEDGYSEHKKSANHNTILVDGKGQEHPGRPEGGQWSQPGGDSMDRLAYFTNWKDSASILLAEGEAADYYVSGALSRYRRDFIYNEGKYVLVLDDIRANTAADITWLVQSPQLTEVEAAAGKYLLAHTKASSPMQIVASSPYEAVIGDSPADSRGTLLGFKQLQVQFDAITGLQVSSVHGPWGGNPTVSVDLIDDDHATITVSGDGYVDTWTWVAATDDDAAATLTMTSTDGQSFSSEPEPWEEFFFDWNYRLGGEGWFKNKAIGYLYPESFPWVLHSPLGWLYCYSSSESGMFLWSVDTGDWIWVSRDFSPWYYDYAAAQWVKGQ